jgi:carboxyl-terminal processing protease
MQKSERVVRNIIIAILLVVLGGVVGYRLRELAAKLPGGKWSLEPRQLVQLANTTPPTQYQNVDFKQFWNVWKILEDNYVDPSKLKPDQMVYGAIKGMTASLGDPYTMFLPPTDEKRSEEDLQGSFFGVGIQLGYVDNTLAVMTPLKDSPADKAGIKAKDLILHVKDEKKGLDKDTTGWSLVEAVDQIRGDKGAPVTLTLFRKDDKTKQPFEVTLLRDEIVVPTVVTKYETANGKKIAEITLSRFGEKTQDELNKAIQDMRQQGKISGIILDMRNNPGGFLEQAISVGSEFIKKGLIVSQKGKDSNKDYEAIGTARLADYPVVVLVNGGSASAAEIVAGALRDQRSAELIGEKTFGKGTVQDAMQLDNGAGLHVTIARWLLPKGDWINEQGIPVNIEVKDDPKTDQDEVLEKAKSELLLKM